MLVSDLKKEIEALLMEDKPEEMDGFNDRVKFLLTQALNHL